jgi:hypothetical protein
VLADEFRKLPQHYRKAPPATGGAFRFFSGLGVLLRGGVAPTIGNSQATGAAPANSELN